MSDRSGKIHISKSKTGNQFDTIPVEIYQPNVRLLPALLGKFSIELRAGIIHNGAAGTTSRGCESRGRTINRAVFLHGRGNNLITSWDRKAIDLSFSEWLHHGGLQHEPVLSTHLSRRSSLLPDLGSERVDLPDDQLFHPLDRVFLFESKVEFLFAVMCHSTALQILKRKSGKYYEQFHR